MPQFSYKAKTNPSDIVSGFIQADNQASAIAKIIQSGQTPIEVVLYQVAPVAAKATQKNAVKSVKIPAVALFQFTRQLADLLEAGIPLIRSIELLSRQRQFPVMNNVIDLMKVYLQQGGSLSAALSQHPSVFPSLYVNMVKASEATGQLPIVLNRLAQFLEKDMLTQGKIKSSLMYPLIILAVGLLTIVVLLTFVLPRLTAMFDDFGATLPLATRIVVGLSNFFAHFWWALLALILMVGFWCQKMLSTPEGKLWFDQQLLTWPIVKPLIENAQMARFARTLGTLLESGVPVVAALDSVVLVVDNIALQEEVKKIAVKVRGGVSLTQAVKGSPLFPEIAVDLIAIGQESGKLEHGLYKLAIGCERVSDEMSQTLLTVLGPAVLVLVVGFVGFMIVSMLMPMFQLNSIIN